MLDRALQLAELEGVNLQDLLRYALMQYLERREGQFIQLAKIHERKK